MTSSRCVVAAAFCLSMSGVCEAQVRQVNIATNATDPGNSGGHRAVDRRQSNQPARGCRRRFLRQLVGNAERTRVEVVGRRASPGGASCRFLSRRPGLVEPTNQKVGVRLGRPAAHGRRGLGASNSSISSFAQTGAADAALTVGAAFGGDNQPHLDINLFNHPVRAPGDGYSPWLNFGIANERSTVTNSGEPRRERHQRRCRQQRRLFPNRTSRVAIAPNGRVYLIYKTREGGLTAEPNAMENAHFRVTRFDDCGATWNANGAGGVSIHGAGAVQTFFTNQFGNPAGGRPVARARSSDAWIATDPGDGEIYAAYVRREGAAFGQIFVARSTDQGVTWTSTRVTDGTQHSAYPESLPSPPTARSACSISTSSTTAWSRSSAIASRDRSTTARPGTIRSCRA